jgi:hypothetical protein
MARTSFGLMSQTSDLFKVLSDDKCHFILKTIGSGVNRRRGEEIQEVKGIDSINTVSLTKLGQKAYHERLSLLIKTDLITERKIEIQNNKTNTVNKDNGYMLTEKGQKLYDACTTIEDAISIKPKLKALDSLLETSNLQETREADEIKKRLTDALIENHKLNDSLQIEYVSNIALKIESRCVNKYGRREETF